jgi:catechol 2,3-dioxygenase-like lactoylglutathione lyase family enzyme
MQPRISLITLGVDDLAAAVHFYEEGLGLPRLAMPEATDIAFFPLQGTWLGLYPRTVLAEDVGVSARGDGFPGITLAHNVASRDEVDRVLAQAVAAGARLIKPAREVFWGGYSGYFSDPDGHLWEVAWNPHFWIGPEDEGAPGSV